MKDRLVWMSILLVFAAALAACAPAVPQAAGAPASPAASATGAFLDPEVIAQNYIAAANSGDLQKALDFYAEDAIAKTGVGVFVGKAEIAKWLANDVKTTHAEPTNWHYSGPFVIVNGTVSLARFKQIGIDQVEFRTEYIIDQAGKIHFFAPAVVLSSSQQEKLKAAQAQATPPPTPAVNPLAVVKAYEEAAGSGDFEKALAFYADDSGALVSDGARLLSGKQQIAAWLKADLQTTRATPEDWQVNVGTVVSSGHLSMERFKKLGIDPVKYHAEYVVDNGKIHFFRPTLELTSGQQATIQAAQPTAAP